MDVFELHDANKCVFLVRGAEHAYFCTKIAIKGVFGHPASMGVFEMHIVCVFLVWCAERTYLYTKIVINSVFGVVRRTHIPLHQNCERDCLRIPSMDVFEMHDAKNCVFLVRRAERTYVCTKSASKSLFGYLVWVGNVAGIVAGAVAREGARKFGSQMTRYGSLEVWNPNGEGIIP